MKRRFTIKQPRNMYRSLRRKKCVHMFHVCTYEIEKQWGERERDTVGGERERDTVGR